MTLRSSGPPDTASWYKIWEAATFLTGMCAMQGKKGIYTQLGRPPLVMPLKIACSLTIISQVQTGSCILKLQQKM